MDAEWSLEMPSRGGTFRVLDWAYSRFPKGTQHGAALHVAGKGVAGRSDSMLST